jgi:hypothetical protein
MAVWGLNPDYDEHAVFHKAVLDLIKLDAEGCRIVKAVAAAIIDYDHWLPLEPTSEFDYDRGKFDEQRDAFYDLCKAMLDNCDLAYRLAPLAQTRHEYQTTLEAEEADDARRLKRYRRRRVRSAAPVVHLVPPDEPGAD